MKKKFLKITGILLILILGILIAIPFFLEAKIGDIIKNNVNNNIKGSFDFTEADLSLLSSFPNAEISIRELVLVNESPFEGDTLFTANEVALKVGISELFKSADESIHIKHLLVDRAHLNIKIDEAGNANYDIAAESGEGSADPGQSDAFTFAMESYEITGASIIYADLAEALQLEVLEMTHRGTGDLSLETSELETTTSALVSLEMDSTRYLNRNQIQLDALIGIDMKENKYSFLRNEAIINQLPLVFEGFVKVNDKSQEVDISFKTPSSDFKNFLAVIPEAYAKNIEHVKTTGNFTVEGNFEGIVDETHIPKFNIAVRSDDASFKYPDLPKSVTHIHIDTDIKNTTGIAEDTFVEIRKASFNIDEDRFNLSSEIRELMGNTRVKAQVDGKMNLANISKAYPVPAGLNLKGLLTADIRTAFDMASVENKKYEKTRTTGQLNVKGFEYNSGEMANPVKIDAISMSFNPGTVHLKEMTGSTGRTDFNVNGSISNLLGFLFNEEKVQGDFVMRSDTFVLNDFMVEDDEENGSAGKGTKESQPATPADERIKIPSFLDCTVNAAANTVHYDNLTLKDVKGNLRIRDEKAVLSDMTSSMFDGRLTLNGEVSTKNEKPLFAMQLGMDGFKIGETFKALELFRVLAPIASILEGKLNSAIKISGNLEDDFTPDLKTISGNVLAEVLATDIQAGRAELLTSLSSKLAFLKPEKLNLKGLKTALSFEDGTVKVKPFTITYDDIAIKVAGGHTFDQKMSYTASLDVPAKYLGKEVNDLIARIDEKEVTSLTIPVAANIGGGYTNPVITTDFTSGIKDLTTKLVEIQKQKLINQGKGKATDLIGGLLADNRTKKDSIGREDSTKAGIKDVLGGVLATNTKKKDTAISDTIPAKKDPVESTARDILGGLLGKKKKDTTKAKANSVN